MIDGDIAKKIIVEILNSNNETFEAKKARIKSILDEFKGSYAVLYFLQAVIEAGYITKPIPSGLIKAMEYVSVPTTIQKAQKIIHKEIPGSIQCAGCDGGFCTKSISELRVLPISSSGDNMILCLSCYKHEMAYRLDENKRGKNHNLTRWEDLKLYEVLDI